MPTESELRDQLHGAKPAGSSRIDADAVIRRAKVRRAPRQVAFGAVAVLAVAGVTALGVYTVPSLFSLSTGASDSATMSGAVSPSSESGAENRGGSQSLGDAGPGTDGTLTSRCGAASVAIAPNPLGLVLTPVFPTSAAADGQRVTGTVTLTNSGTSRAVGSTAVQPVITLSRDGITVWHSNGAVADLGRLVDLDPGQSMTYSASFTPVVCSPEDEAGYQFRANLPKFDAGTVTLTATIQFIPEGATTAEGVIVSGPPETITLH